MGIQPIDLQMVYSQLDKVSKNAVFQQQGLQTQNAINEDVKAHKINEKNKAVEQAAAEENNAVKVRDENSQKDNQNLQNKKKQENKEEVAVEEIQYEVIRDPSLGSYFDIVG